MSRPRTLPEDNSELEALIRRHGAVGAASMLGVTKQAISAAVRDRKLNVERRISYKKYIPWAVRAEHQDEYPRRMLYYYAREQEGKTLTARNAGQLRLFKEKMDAMFDGRGAVVQYDPDHEKGPFILVPRREGIDAGYARTPDPETAKEPKTDD